MVAIVTGNGLGLQASSALGLGGRGQIGGAGVGKTGEQAFVNAATGNLILRDRDQWLMGRGVDAELYRAYNSQAQLVGETWRAGVSKQVGGLTGTVNAAGSSVYRTDWDGSRIAYAWDAARSLYVASEGAGTRDTLAWDGGNQRWTWTQGGSQLIERYDAANSGRLIESVDRDGNAVSYVYNGAGALSQVVTANGETTYLDYDSNGRLSQLRTVTQTANGTQTSTAVRYGYDSAGRLGTVTLDLSPDDNSVADGKVFTTTYGYDGSSGRIASITQSDGAKVAFGYQLIDGQYRVVSIAQTSDAGVLRTTTLSYDTANRRTTIVDPLGQDTILSYDAQGRLLQTSSPMVNGAHQTQTFTYDAAGQVATIRDGLGNEVKYTYDAAGNLIKQEDAVGTVVERTFGSDNQLLSETVSGPNTATATTRYVYDAEQHLRFKVSAEGRVSELRYNAAGQLIATLGYSEGNYAGSTFTEAALTAWAGATARIGERTDSEYDFRGNLSQVTRYATLAADGSGVLDDQVIRTRFVYDAQGRLLQRYVGPIAAPEVEQFVYDGLGRTIRVTGFNDAVTVTQYDDAQRRTVTTLANGLVRTSIYNHAGELIALAESDSGGTLLSQVRYHYDADGRLRMSEDALGAKTHVLYDEAGRRVGEIDAAGALTEYVYDGNNQVAKTTVYASAVSATGLASLLDANGKPKQTIAVNGQQAALTLANSGLRPIADVNNDRSAWRFYDKAGRLIKTLDSAGAAVEYRYDAASRLVATVAHSNKISVGAFRIAPTLEKLNSLIQPSAADRLDRYFYSADGQLLATLNANGAMVEHRYDAMGRKTKTIEYYFAVPAAKRAAGTLDEIRPQTTIFDKNAYAFYDARGLLTAEVDGEGYITRYRYDSVGNVARRIQGERLAPGVLDAPVSVTGSFKARMTGTASQPMPTVEVWVDGVKVKTVSVDSASDTSYSFTAQVLAGANHRVSLVMVPGDGRTIELSQANLAGVAFDATGRVAWEAGGDGQNAGTPSVRPSGAQSFSGSGAMRWSVASLDALASLVQTPGLVQRSDYEYDVEGRLLKKTDFSSSGNIESSYAYDSLGQMVAARTADRKALSRYDLQGRLTAQLSGEGVRALEALGANPAQAAVNAVWNQWGQRYEYDAAGRRTAMVDALGRSTLFYYDASGRLVLTVNPTGEAVEQRYNVFGEAEQVIAYAKRIASLSLGQMHGGTLTDAVRSVIASIDDAQASKSSRKYNLVGLLEQATDENGGRTEYLYNAYGQETQSTRWTSLVRSDATRIVDAIYYDFAGIGFNNARDIWSFNSQTGRYVDAFGRLNSIMLNSELQGAWRYDRNDRVVGYQIQNGTSSEVSDYDAFGNVIKKTDRAGNSTLYSYTAFNREIRTVSAEGIETLARYNEHGQVVELTDGRGNKTVYEYDLDGRLIRTTSPAGESRVAYDRAGQVIETRDARGVRTVYEYDGAGRTLSRTVDPDGLAIVERFEYDPKGLMVRSVDPNGVATEFRYDLKGQRTLVVVDAGDGRLNLATRYEYDAIGQLVKVVAGDGTAAAKVTAYSYDKLGRKISETVDPDGLALKTVFTYNKLNDLVAKTDPSGAITRFVYDTAHRLTSTVDAAGGITRQVYDQDGRLLSRTAYANPAATTGLALELKFSDINALVRADTNNDRTIRYAYDRDNRLRYVVDASGSVVESIYDNTGNVVRSIAYATPIASTVAATVAAVSAALAAQGSAAHLGDRSSLFVYDAAGRAVFQLDPGRYLTRNNYDANGNLIGRVRYMWPYPANAATGLSDLLVWADRNENTASPPISRDRWIYDAANRLTWEIDARGYVTRTVYDAAGHRTRRAQYQEGTEYPYTKPAEYTDAGMRAWAARTSGGDAPFVNPATLWFYDTAGREVFAFNAEGYLVETRYDARGNLERTVQYDKQWPAYYGATDTITDADTAASVAAKAAGGAGASTSYRYDAAGRVRDKIDALGGVTRYEYDSLGQVVAEFQAWGTPDQVAVRRRYDAVGRMTEETRAADTPQASHTRYAYDAFGQLVSTVDPRGVELVELDSPWALELRWSLGYRNETGAALVVASLSAAQKEALLALYTSRSVYDASGRLSQSIDALGGVVTRTYDGFGNAVEVRDAGGNVGRFYFDAKGNVTHQVDPEGYLTVTEYDYRGNATVVRRYANRVSGQVSPNALPSIPAGAVSETRMTYNAAGALIGTTDAEGKGELYGYDQFGYMSLFTNKLGAKTAYFRDKLGRVTSETYLDVSVVDRFNGAARPLRIDSRYDARGNLVRRVEAVQSAEERITVFAYDALNRRTSATETVATGQATVNAVEKSSFDARGNLIEKIAVNGARTVYYYDAANRLSGQVGPNGLLTRNEYDAAGNLVRTLAFVRAVALPAGWTLPADPLNPATGKPDEVRETRFAYDANGRRIESRTKGVAHGILENGVDQNGNPERSYKIDARDIVETWSYDANGRAIAHVDGAGNVVRTFYDALGQKRLEIDGEGYAVAWERDAEGNVLKETRYAKRQQPPAQTLLAASANDEAEQLISSWPTSADDRVTLYSYDKMGRRLTESRLSVAYGSVDAATGRLSEGFATATTAYAYDAAGNLLRRTDANGSVFGWEYDKAGRNTAIILPGFVDYSGRSVTARTEYSYNGLNQVVKETRRGVGSDQDQVDSYVYGAGGRLLSKTNALNFTTRFGYDASGNMTAMSYLRTDSAGGQRTETIQVAYDQNNREVSRVTVGGDGSRSVERRTDYNLFGDVTGRGTGPTGWQEFAEYDYAGRVLRTNMDGGITRVHVYDGAGNAAVRIESRAEDLSKWTLARVLEPSDADAEKLSLTLTLYDGRNQAIDVIQASMSAEGERLGLKTVTVRPIVPGAIQSSVGGRLGQKARDQVSRPEDGVPTIAPTNANTVPSLSGNAVPFDWRGGGDSTPPTAMTYRLNIPDYRSAFGSEYQVRVVLEGQQAGPHSGRWEDMDKPLPVYSLLGQFVGDQNSVAADMQVPIFLRNVATEERRATLYFTVKVYVTPRGSGGGREILVGSASNVGPDGKGAEIKWDRSWDHNGRVDLMSGSLATATTGELPPEFSGHVIQMPGDAYRSDVSPQVYVRPKGSSGPYQLLPLQRDFGQGKATVDVAGLADGPYDMIYVATRTDGALMRREKYDLVVGSTQSIARAPDTLDNTFQTNSLGTFVWTSNGLDMSNLLTYRSQVPKKVVVEYRRKGSQDAWGGTNGLPGLPPMATPGSVRWDTTGLNGDYEVVLKLLGDNDTLLDSIKGEVSVGANPRVALDFAHDADVVRLSNLPPNASAVDLTLLNEDGSVAWTAAGLSIANGALNWPIPPEILAAAGDGVRRYGMKLTFTDNRVVPPSSYNAVGSIEVGPQREPKAVIQVDRHLYTLNLDPKQPEGQVLVLHYRPEGNVNTPFQEVVILRGADGKFRWDSLGLNKEATYEYFYDVFRTLAEAQNPAGSQSLVRNSGYFWPDNDRPATEASWEIKNFEPSSLTIHRRQEYNAFGEIAREIDGRGNATALSYNTLGKLTRKTDPLVWVTRANGFREQINPFTQYVNDLAGNVVAYRDANGNLTTQAWNYGSAKPTLVGEWHADGGFKRFQYDVFGNQRVSVDELGRTTGYGYDRGNRLVSIQRPKGEGETGEIVDSYAYDELDRRIRHTSSLLGATTTDFNIEGEVSRVVTAGGRTTTYSSVWSDAITGNHAGWIRTMTDANGRSLIDYVDAFGRKFMHKDLGDRWFTYEYNHAGLLSSSGTTVYEYYANGLIKRMNDAGSGIKAYYEYDENGNRTFEGFTGKDGNWAFQQSKATYDALNRLIKVDDPRYEITYEFDAQGNRIRMHSLYKDGLNGASRVQEYWYQYDSMNRFTVTMGKLSGNGQTRGSSASDNSVWVYEGNEDGVLLAYDQANQRRMAKYGRDGHTERYDYDARGYLTDTVIDGVLRARRVNDLAGRVGDYYEYDANGTLKNSSSRTWDNDSLLMLEHDNLANKGTETYRLADGTVDFTETYGEETTVKTSYTYEWFDSAKQSQIMVQASNQDVKNWAPGFSRYVYDSQGRIKLAYDQAGNRGFAYQVDGEGRILQRDELIGGEVDANGNVVNAQQNRHHSYYFFDDRQIGNVGNDGIDRIDYAKELAQNEAQAGAKNDDRHKRFTPVAGANFDENYQPINSLYPTAAPGSYIVKSGDTLQGIAAALWGDAAMWYLLADANGLAPNQPLIPNTVLTVPNKVTNIHNNASTFKPYDAGSAMGNTSPTAPEPPPPPAAKKGCGGFVQVLAIVVAVVVTIYTAGAAAAAMSATLSTGGAIGATMSAGLSVLGGTAVGGLGAGALVGAAAIGGAVGSIASQAVLIAGGVQDKFDWKGVALGAAGGAISAGMATSGFGSALSRVGIRSEWAQTAARAVAGNVASQGVAVALGVQNGFDWKGAAISAVSASVGRWVGDKAKAFGSARQWGDRTINGFADFSASFASDVTTAAARGNLSSSVLASIGLNAAATTIGHAVSSQMAKQSAPWKGLGTGAMDAGAMLDRLWDREARAWSGGDVLAAGSSDGSGSALSGGANGGGIGIGSPTGVVGTNGDIFSKTPGASMSDRRYGYYVPRNYEEVLIDRNPDGGRKLAQLSLDTSAWVAYQNVIGNFLPTPPGVDQPEALVSYNHWLQAGYAQKRITVDSALTVAQRDHEELLDTIKNVTDAFRGDSLYGDIRANEAMLLADVTANLYTGARSVFALATDRQSQREFQSGLIGLGSTKPMDLYNKAVMSTSDFFGLPSDQMWRKVGAASGTYLAGLGVEAATAKALEYGGGLARKAGLVYEAEDALRFRGFKAREDWALHNVYGNASAHQTMADWIPNADGPRSLEQALKIAEDNGVDVPDYVRLIPLEDDVYFGTGGSRGVGMPNSDATYGRLDNVALNEIVSWKSRPGKISLLDSDGRLPVFFRKSVLNSDRAIVAIFGHETSEIWELEAEFQRSGGMMRVKDYNALVSPSSGGENAHTRAVAFGDDLVKAMKKRGL
ncbi:LysM peptidoglycan-binding domain-containing protein [Lysobacter enzymogenes]|uniref:LysM peptidoglycan-binding domain-containing protein n=1 Tax=Lysobacter enzymogenes TaxID=69 RepID=UPI001A95BBA7|nr:LysM peptidoglycan-binding domain-containing protein [Lysobacter enzymogenes]QQP94346.1 LysM peptidoglycan-binding domain-containing protein [Lysobacter enzymogenes]